MSITGVSAGDRSPQSLRRNSRPASSSAGELPGSFGSSQSPVSAMSLDVPANLQSSPLMAMERRRLINSSSAPKLESVDPLRKRLPTASSEAEHHHSIELNAPMGFGPKAKALW